MSDGTGAPASWLGDDELAYEALLAVCRQLIAPGAVAAFRSSSEFERDLDGEMLHHQLWAAMHRLDPPDHCPDAEDRY